MPRTPFGNAAARRAGVLLCAALGLLLELPAAQGAPAGETERDLRWRTLGLVPILEIDSTLAVDLIYAKPDNFAGITFYTDLSAAWLQREAALMLREANANLRRIRPDLHLLVVDALRPRSAQRRMWELVRRTPNRRYVADPSRGSMHNYGAAVDLTLAGPDGPIDMGSPIDGFGPAAQPRMEPKLLRDGKLTREQVENRRLLRRVMVKAGFRPLSIEWWHFEAFGRNATRSKFPLVN